MDVIWWGIPIAGCVALAACVAAALLPPRRDTPETLRPLANTARLTALPEYARAIRRHTVTACVAAGLLVLAFAATAFAAGRPTGLPAPDRGAVAEQPEDIMVCVGGPATDPIVNDTLRYFGEAAQGFGTERIGLTSANRRLIPLTRDYQYAAGRFAGYAQQVAPLVSAVTYADYAPSVQDVLALCMTGFPDFDSATAQRRSLIYVGPGSLDTGPGLFTDQQVRDLAGDGAIQVNAVTDGDGFATELARDTGGRAYPQTTDVAAHLDDIRTHQPDVQRDAEGAATRSVETPDLLLVTALLAVIALLAWPLVVRR